MNIWIRLKICKIIILKTWKFQFKYIWVFLFISLSCIPSKHKNTQFFLNYVNLQAIFFKKFLEINAWISLSIENRLDSHIQSLLVFLLLACAC